MVLAVAKFLNFDQGKPGKVRENQFLQVLTTMPWEGE
jgi:hypothetical protein